MSNTALDPPNLGCQRLAELYREHHSRVLGLCRYLLGSPEEAEDAASEVFLRLPHAMRTYDPSQPFSRWLSSVTSHYCVDLLRRRQSEMRLMEPENPAAPEPAAQSATPLEELLSAEERESVREAIAALPEHYRLPLVMRYFNDLDYSEISATLGLTRGHVATLIFRAKAELRGLMGRNQKVRDWSRISFEPAAG